MGSLFSEKGNAVTLIRNEDALDNEFVPKLLPYREGQQRRIASAIQPLLQDRTGRNVFVHGLPGIGKTAAAQWVLKDLEDNADGVASYYINCWQKNSTYKVVLELCRMLDFNFTVNKNTDELLGIVVQLLNKKPCVLVFDEIDKAEEHDFLYNLLGGLYKKSIIAITNDSSWVARLEDRLRSRLLPENLEFKPYGKDETKAILLQRIDYAFVPGAWDAQAVNVVVERTFAARDIRTGIFLLREAGRAAEEAGSRRILPEHVQAALERLPRLEESKAAGLEDDEQLVLGTIKEHSGKLMGDLYQAYEQAGGKATYKTFQRRIERLEKAGLAVTRRVTGGREGNSTAVEYTGSKTLAEYARPDGQ
jgi:cell division control protein 6